MVVLYLIFGTFLLSSQVRSDACSDLCHSHLGKGSCGTYCKKGRDCHSLYWTSSAKTAVCFRDSAHKECPKTHKISCTEALERMSGRITETTEAPPVETKKNSRHDSSGSLAKHSKTFHGSAVKTPKTKMISSQISGRFLETTEASPVETKKASRHDSSRAPAKDRKSSHGSVNTSKTKRTSSHPTVVEVPHLDSSSGLRFMVMGDFGRPNEHLQNTMHSARTYYSGSHLTSALMLGDNFYKNGVASVHDPLFKAVFEDILVSNFPGLAFHMILGNHDWEGNVEAQTAYGHPQWIMPSFYYNRKFRSGDTTACVWFLETEQLKGGDGRAQLAWLEHSLRTESGDCDWKIVTGHRPIFTAGQYHDKEILIKDLLPILERNGVNLYMSGHEHRTQVLHNPAQSPITFIIAGCSMSMRGPNKQKDHNMVVWTDSDHFAFVDLTITRNQLVYTVINAEVGGRQRPLYQGTIRRRL